MAENRNEELSINYEFCPSYSLEETHVIVGDMQDVGIKNTPIKGKFCIHK